MTLRKPVIAIIGGSTCSQEEYETAAAVGRYIAEHGGIIVCGGLGGIMEAAARGASDGGGLSIGFLPTTDKRDANPFIDIAIPTGFGEARNALVVRAADAVIAFPGRFGTLSEMALALTSAKPLISLSNWELGPDVQKVREPLEAAKLALELARANQS